MKTRQVIVRSSAALAAMLMAQAAAQAQQMGRIVVANDEWTLGPPGFQQPSDGTAFAVNIASWFTGGQPGSFFAWNHYSLNDGELANAMTAAGHTWTVGSTGSVTLPFLQQYDGVFLCAVSVPNGVLIEYVEQGGSVYVAAGSGAWIGPGWEASAWNTFLGHFGLQFHDVWNTASQTHLPVSESHPIFAGVDHLWHDVGQGVFDVQPQNPANRVFLPVPGAPEQGHYAVFDSSPCDADCNGSGSLSVADFTCFQARFVAGDPYADCNLSGTLTVSDFTCYQAKFVAGCP